MLLVLRAVKRFAKRCYAGATMDDAGKPENGCTLCDAAMRFMRDPSMLMPIPPFPFSSVLRLSPAHLSAPLTQVYCRLFCLPRLALY